jgi:type II secretory pathway pseudopilin PulG
MPPGGALRRIRRRARGREGFMLVELLVAMSLFTLGLGGVLITLQVATSDSNNETERNVALSQVTTGVAGIVAELRRAYQVSSLILESKSSTPNRSTWTSSCGFRASAPGACSTTVPTESGYYDCVRYQSKQITGFTAGVVPTEEVESQQIVVPRVLNETTADERDPASSRIVLTAADGLKNTEIAERLRRASRPWARSPASWQSPPPPWHRSTSRDLAVVLLSVLVDRRRRPRLRTAPGSATER